MGAFRDEPEARRFIEEFEAADGSEHTVWADYAAQGKRRALLHVEAEDALRGSGAAGRFMQHLADHARAEGLSLTPICGYAVAWFRRHPDQGDLLA